MTQQTEQTQTKQIRVVLVEDHEITRVGLKLILQNTPDVEIVAEAGNGKEAIEVVTQTKPDVVLMDIGLPLMDGIQATAEIKKRMPEVRIIMLTSHATDQHVFAALGAGADAYCLKETSAVHLSLAVRTVAEGAAWLDPGIAAKVLKASAVAGMSDTAKSPRDMKDSAFAKLSQREIEVLKLVVDGLSNQEIAEKLVVSVETVKTHMRRLMEKLAVSDRTQAAVKAMREGLF